jgi:nitrogen fixation/metabolism regulation signal transduction histidine kinase
LLQGEYLRLADELVRAVNRAEGRSITRQIKVRVHIEMLTLLVKVAILRDEEERYLGMVAVVDDLTQLQSAAAEAWRRWPGGSPTKSRIPDPHPAFTNVCENST